MAILTENLVLGEEHTLYEKEGEIKIWTAEIRATDLRIPPINLRERIRGKRERKQIQELVYHQRIKL